MDPAQINVRYSTSKAKNRDGWAAMTARGAGEEGAHATWRPLPVPASRPTAEEAVAVTTAVRAAARAQARGGGGGWKPVIPPPAGCPRRAQGAAGACWRRAHARHPFRCSVGLPRATAAGFPCLLPPQTRLAGSPLRTHPTLHHPALSVVARRGALPMARSSSLYRHLGGFGCAPPFAGAVETREVLLTGHVLLLRQLMLDRVGEQGRGGGWCRVPTGREAQARRLSGR